MPCRSPQPHPARRDRTGSAPDAGHAHDGDAASGNEPDHAKEAGKEAEIRSGAKVRIQMFRKVGRMAERINGAFTEMDGIEDELIRAVNEARARLPEYPIEYEKALRALNHFALTKPIKGNTKELVGLD